MLANSFDIAVINAVKSIERSTRKSVKKARPNCMTASYSPSLDALIMETARSASCRCRLIEANLYFGHAAAMSFVMDVITPISLATNITK